VFLSLLGKSFLDFGSFMGNRFVFLVQFGSVNGDFLCTFFEVVVVALELVQGFLGFFEFFVELVVALFGFGELLRKVFVAFLKLDGLGFERLEVFVLGFILFRNLVELASHLFDVVKKRVFFLVKLAVFILEKSKTVKKFVHFSRDSGMFVGGLFISFSEFGVLGVEVFDLLDEVGDLFLIGFLLTLEVIRQSLDVIHFDEKFRFRES
jgi:hypothetical protein